jgi:biofilm PGA synthesis N-glycosyltransferase PgaC
MDAARLAELVSAFCFGYPFVMAWYWMAGGLLYHFVRERHEPLPESPPRLAEYPGVSILVPCHNEERQLEETLGVLAAIDYPEFEIVAINDGSKDRTGPMLDALAQQIPQLRVVHLARNQGKSSALNVGALLARHEMLVCIDGDALLDSHAVTWLVRRFQSDAGIGALTGNPRIRNRASLLGRLQVGEFSSIVGLVKRAQTLYGRLFTISGVVCAFRKRALADAGWWAPGALTDDVEATWRIQLAGWRVVFEPKALCWILMPETLRGLWRQRLRWAEGGAQTILASTGPMFRTRSWRLVPVWLNFVVSIAWSYAVIAGFAIWLLASFGAGSLYPFGIAPLLSWWGSALALTYLVQAVVSVGIDTRFEKGVAGSIFWIIWYPLVFWLLQAVTAIVGLPRALLRSRHARGTWVSPDRGIR